MQKLSDHPTNEAPQLPENQTDSLRSKLKVLCHSAERHKAAVIIGVFALLVVVAAVIIWQKIGTDEEAAVVETASSLQSDPEHSNDPAVVAGHNYLIENAAAKDQLN